MRYVVVGAFLFCVLQGCGQDVPPVEKSEETPGQDAIQNNWGVVRNAELVNIYYIANRGLLGFKVWGGEGDFGTWIDVHEAGTQLYVEVNPHMINVKLDKDLVGNRLSFKTHQWIFSWNKEHDPPWPVWILYSDCEWVDIISNNETDYERWNDFIESKKKTMVIGDLVNWHEAGDYLLLNVREDFTDFNSDYVIAKEHISIRLDPGIPAEINRVILDDVWFVGRGLYLDPPHRTKAAEIVLKTQEELDRWQYMLNR